MTTLFIRDAGSLSLSPSTVAKVCRVGDDLKLTCNSNGSSFLRWNIPATSINSITTDISRNINSDDVGQQTSNATVNHTFLNFTRISKQRVMPLVTTLTFYNVSINFNGTVVRCMELEGSMALNSTVIQIADNRERELV